MPFRFERLKLWPKAVDFADQVIDLSLRWSGELQSSLGDQTRRAAVLVVANIAAMLWGLMQAVIKDRGA